MTPDRIAYINGHKIEEFYWAGKMVVYVDSRTFDGDYSQAIEQVKAEKHDHQ